MPAHRVQRCAVGRALLLLTWTSSAICSRGTAQQPFPAAPEQPSPQINALADRLALQLLEANKKRPLIADLTLPNDAPSPLGAWLADQISNHLTQAYPRLDVIARQHWTSLALSTDQPHDRNQELAERERLAQQLGAEILVQGNFAAIPGGIGITLLAGDHLVGGSSRYQALAELPLTPDMTALLGGPLPTRVSIGGAYRASIAGIGSPLCEDCPPPSYTYVARVQKLTGVVIAQVRVSTAGLTENVQIVRAPNEALANAALHTVRTWRFRPARNFQGELVPVIVDVAVSFRLDAFQPDATSAMNKKY